MQETDTQLEVWQTAFDHCIYETQASYASPC